MKMDVWIEPCDTPIGHLTRGDDKALSFVYAKGAGKEQQLSLSGQSGEARGDKRLKW